MNQQLRVRFSRPVDPSSVNAHSIRVTDGDGLTPAGEFRLDPNDPSVRISQPPFTFDSSGDPIFGLRAGESYSVFVPGASSDPGPWVRSTSGDANPLRMACDVVASRAVLDLVPGARLRRPALSRCRGPLVGPDSPVPPGSLTPRVAHPVELKAIAAEGGGLRPDLLRFVVVFDPGDAALAPLLAGVDELRVRVQPD